MSTFCILLDFVANGKTGKRRSFEELEQISRVFRCLLCVFCFVCGVLVLLFHARFSDWYTNVDDVLDISVCYGKCGVVKQI